MTDVVSVPNEASIRAAFAEAEKEAAFWREHYQEYVGQYPDQFVAVSKDEKTVVATGHSLDYLLGFIEGRGLRVRQMWVKFIAATPQHVSLSSRAS
jgi:hypothetical protein